MGGEALDHLRWKAVVKEGQQLEVEICAVK